MWISKGAAVIRGRRLFEARRLLEEIQFIGREVTMASLVANIIKSHLSLSNHYNLNFFVCGLLNYIEYV